MISRRLIRIKVLKILFSYLNSGGTSIENAEKELIFSLNKTYELYHYFLLLPIEVADYAAQQIALGKQKNRPTEAERNPNTKFADNAFVQLLREHANLHAFVEKHKFQWSPDVVKKAYQSLRSSPYYQQYMNRRDRSFFEDKMLIIMFLEREFEDDEELNAALEEQSIYWADDLEFALSHSIKTCKSFGVNDNDTNELLPQYKESEDEEFASRLLSTAVLKSAEYQQIVDKYTKNWDVERVAFMDVVIMITAIAELITFTNVPIKVSLNEYIEIAKYYSTPSSSTFINGVLDKIVIDFTEQKIITKEGRGMVADNE
ncbi:N utilization substance protein B [Bacteroidia bacterium]|nr:N utilization substance protein B [Bacteroidia bacterium]